MYFYSETGGWETIHGLRKKGKVGKNNFRKEIGIKTITVPLKLYCNIQYRFKAPY